MMVHGLFEETSTNPVRARRCEALYYPAKLIGCRNLKNIIGANPRRPFRRMLNRNIGTSKILP